MKSILCLVLVVTSFNSFCSNWEKLNNGFDWAAESIFIDSMNNLIYVGGAFNYADSIKVRGISVWDGVKWDSLGEGCTLFLTNGAITKFQNQIYSDGCFGNSTQKFLGRFNGTTWDTLGDGIHGPVKQMKEVNNELWIAGQFNEVNGSSCDMITSWNGINWNCIQTPYWNAINDFLFYNNMLVIGGNFLDSLHNNIDLAFYNGTGFNTFGHPIYGGVSYINTMIVYNNELYIGGYFLVSDGNEGNFIMRWDGANWHSVGTGTDGRINAFAIHNNELYVVGLFNHAGGINTGCLAKWDGMQWSKATISIITDQILDIKFNGNDLYIAGSFKYIDSIEVNYISKYSLTNSIEDINDNEIIIYPNPCSNRLSISGISNEFKIEFCNLIGGTMKSEVIERGNKNNIDISFLNSGVYFLNIIHNNKKITKRIIKI